MQIKATLRPGDKGTRRLLEAYGPRLVCVRYRYDREGRRRLKTVEIIVDEKPWIHCPRFREASPTVPVRIHVGFAERELRDRVKEAGGTWDPKLLLWTLQLDAVRRLGIENRIIHGTGFYIS